MLATIGMENSRSDFWAIVVGADGAWVTDSTAGGVIEKEAVGDRFFLRSAFVFSM